MNKPRKAKSPYELWEEKVERRKIRAAIRLDRERTFQEEQKIAAVTRMLDLDKELVPRYHLYSGGTVYARPILYPRNYNKVFKEWTKQEINDYIKGTIKDKEQKTED